MEPAAFAPIRKIKLSVVAFEKANDREDSTEKKAVIKPMILDVEYIKFWGIREWDTKGHHVKDKWTVLFDKLKQGESIIIAKPMNEVEDILLKAGIIQILNAA